MKTKLAIVISHPIQHFCPQYASLAKHPSLEVKVFFASALGFKKYMDLNFGSEISWGNLRLEQFDHVFLNGERAIPADKELDAENLEGALEAFGPDIVLIHGYFQKFQRRAYNWTKKRKVSMAYIADSERRQRSKGGLRQLIKMLYLKNFFSKIGVFLTVGDANEEYYRHHGVSAGKMVRMHFSIDRLLYQDAFGKKDDLRKQTREKYSLPAGDIVLLVVGKLVSWKNQVDIIMAMKALENRNIATTLFVIGSGEQMDQLKETASVLKASRVVFPGFVTPEDLPAYYAVSDIYIHPAAIEPHSLAISEAIYMGCPVIISDRCGSFGPNDDVQEGKNGYVFKCGDIEDLAAKMLLLVKDANKRRRFGTYSHEIAERFQQRSHGGFVNEMIQKLRK